MHGFWKLVSAFLLTFLVCIEAQCEPGTGWNGTKCSACIAGYYCEGGSGTVGPSVTSTFAGTGNAVWADNTGTSASFNSPFGIAIDPFNSFVLVADTTNHRIRRIVIATGVVTTLAGTTSAGFIDSATGTSAAFNTPRAVTIDTSGTFALVTDAANNRIRRIALPSGAVTTFAGSGSANFIDNTGTSAAFNVPSGVDISGTIAIIADSNNHCIRKIVVSTAVVTNLAGTVNVNFRTGASTPVAGATDGTGSTASFNFPSGVAIDPYGVYALVADLDNNRIRRVAISTGAVTTLVGSTASWADGTGTSALFNAPFGVAIDVFGTYAYVADQSNHRIRRVDIQSRVTTTMAGSGTASWAEGANTASSFNTPRGVAIDSNNSFIFVADSQNNRIRRILIGGTNLCSAGSYCPAGSSSSTQEDCRAGFYCPTGSSSPTQFLCNSGNYCPAGSSAPSQSSCHAGYYCPAGSSIATQYWCNAGFYCPSGSSSANQSACSAGYYCAAGSSVASQFACSPGYYCAAGSSNSKQYMCSAGYYCPAGSSSATQNVCSLGYFCPPGSSNSTQSACQAGFYCPAGTNSTNSSRYVCSAGYYCPAGSSSPTAAPCGVGFYCPAGSSTSTAVPCSAGYYCVAGSTSATPAICRSGYFCPSGSPSTVCSAGYYCPAGSSSATPFNPATIGVVYNPLLATNALYFGSLVKFGIAFASSFGPLVLFIVLVAVFFEKNPAFKQYLASCSRDHLPSSFNWSALDLFFSDLHYRHTGRPIVIRKTAFGGSMSLATMISIVGVGCVLTFNSVVFPTYSTVVSPQPPPWQPSGLYQLAVTLVGAGNEQCMNASSGFTITSTEADWSSSSGFQTSFNAQDASCRLVWRCDVPCMMIAPSTTTLLLRANGAWATFVGYELTTPMFSSSDQNPVPDYGTSPFVLRGGFASASKGSGSNTNSTMLSGATATTVSLSLTPTVMNSSSLSTSAVAFEPSVLTVAIGSTNETSRPPSLGASGYTISFVLTRNSLSFVYISAINITTFLVLLSSVAGSLISLFAVFVTQLEAFFDIREDSEEMNATPSKSNKPIDLPTIELSDWNSMMKPAAALPVTPSNNTFASLQQLEATKELVRQVDDKSAKAIETVDEKLNQLLRYLEANNYFQR